MSESPHEALDILPDEPGIDLGARQLKRQMLDSLFARAMSGLLPRQRALKSWEPDVLDERHLQALLMRAGGMTQAQIAKMFNWTESWTSVVMNHPDAQYVLTRLISFAADNVVDLETRIKAYAPEALDTAVEIMRSSQDEGQRSKNAFEILKMAGYGSKKPEESGAKPAGTTVNIGQVNVVPAAHVTNLADAIRESRQIKEVTYVLPPAAMAPASDSGDSPASPGSSGNQDADEPPASDSQDAISLEEKVA